MTDVENVVREMEGKTGSVTLHFKYGQLLKIEYRIIKTPEVKKK